MNKDLKDDLVYRIGDEGLGKVIRVEAKDWIEDPKVGWFMLGKLGCIKILAWLVVAAIILAVLLR